MTGLRCMLMRGGTSKGAYFLASDLPVDARRRDELLLRVMGSPDPRQIDGIGGAHPLTSKVAVVSPSTRDDADVDYLFLQPGVDEPIVSGRQNCGNILAGVGPFAVERGLVPADGEHTSVRIHQVNSDSVARATFPTPGGVVRYDGDTAIAGVPGTAAGIQLDFSGTEGSVCGGLLPTGHVRDVLDGVEVTCIDNGMPVVVVAAGDLGLTGDESPEDLAAPGIAERVQSLRSRAGKLMGLGDVSGTSIPTTTVVAPPKAGGTLRTRTFIPVRPHTCPATGSRSSIRAGISTSRSNSTAPAFVARASSARPGNCSRATFFPEASSIDGPDARHRPRGGPADHRAFHTHGTPPVSPAQ
ncbi:PrpF domain-containing protein [Amycolatopsis acididurans]|uniref:PrpF domain-containing protein n=1 Tax=Amycolatopsis acididurans TaxID=2724524 RepID=UPI001FE662DD